MKKQRAYFLMLVVVVLTIVLGTIANTYHLDQTAKEGRMELKKSQEKAPSANFRFQIADTWVFETGEAQGEVLITNPIENPYKTQVSVLLDEDQREIYHTDLLNPGERVRYATLTEKLEQGNYSATAYFKIQNADTEEELGKVAAQLKIQIKN